MASLLTTICASATFLLIMLLSSVLQCNSQPPPPPPPPPQPYAKISFQWPMALCAIHTCIKGPPGAFRLHGAWPTYANGRGMQKCTNQPFSWSAIKVTSLLQYKHFLTNSNYQFWMFDKYIIVIVGYESRFGLLLAKLFR